MKLMKTTTTQMVDSWSVAVLKGCLKEIVVQVVVQVEVKAQKRGLPLCPIPFLPLLNPDSPPLLQLIPPLSLAPQAYLLLQIQRPLLLLLLLLAVEFPAAAAAAAVEVETA
jgi:hypothetical protein